MMFSMICIAALAHCSFVTWLTKSPLRYRFIARTALGFGVGSGTSSGMGVGDGSGVGLGVGSGVTVGVERAVGAGLGVSGRPVIAATSPLWPPTAPKAIKPPATTTAARAPTAAVARIGSGLGRTALDIRGGCGLRGDGVGADHRT
jgi:hypothetical protein